jgi:fumarate reductase subunit D
MPHSAPFSKEDVIDGKMYAVLAYLSILCIIPLILRKKNPFVLAHGKQGLVIFLGQVGVLILSVVLPWFFAPLMFILMIFSFWGMIAVIRGEMVDLPIVSGISQKIDL